MKEDEIMQEIRKIRAGIVEEYPNIRDYWRHLQEKTEDQKKETTNNQQPINK